MNNRTLVLQIELQTQTSMIYMEKNAKALPCVVLKDFEGRCGKTQVPHLDDWKAVIFRGQHQLGGHIRVPQHS